MFGRQKGDDNNLRRQWDVSLYRKPEKVSTDSMAQFLTVVKARVP